jgi:hypothetical protein
MPHGRYLKADVYDVWDSLDWWWYTGRSGRYWTTRRT